MDFIQSDDYSDLELKKQNQIKYMDIIRKAYDRADFLGMSLREEAPVVKRNVESIVYNSPGKLPIPNIQKEAFNSCPF